MQIQVGAEDVFSLASHAREGAAGIGRPYVVAIDGRSGVGKSTLALRLVEALDACLLDGDVYSARPELADLVDLRVLVRAREDTRVARLLAREGTTGPWERQWHEAEEWYFTQVSRPQAFDVVVDGDGAAGS
jgi:uridine kinase